MLAFRVIVPARVLDPKSTGCAANREPLFHGVLSVRVLWIPGVVVGVALSADSSDTAHAGFFAVVGRAYALSVGVSGPRAQDASERRRISRCQHGHQLCVKAPRAVRAERERKETRELASLKRKRGTHAPVSSRPSRTFSLGGSCAVSMHACGRISGGASPSVEVVKREVPRTELLPRSSSARVHVRRRRWSNESIPHAL